MTLATRWLRTRLAVSIFALTAACSASTGGSASTAGTTSTPAPSRNFAVQVASTDLYAGEPQRVQVGVFASDQQAGVLLLTGGEISVDLSPFEGGAGTPAGGPARYLPAPGTQGSELGEPALTPPDVSRGVYQLDPVIFDAPGIWQADVTFQVEGESHSLSTQFQVLEEPSLPAPGQPAIPTENLTVDSKAPAEAIDSRASDGSALPDPELHGLTIAQAIDQGVPALVLFSTPVYCQSQFCGPAVDALSEMAASGPREAAYIHVEIWRNYSQNQVNEAAAEWLLRDGELTEPWLFLIGPDGTILDRWGPLFDPQEVLAELQPLD